MKNTKRIVITGSPGSGKTTYIHLLKDKGFTIIEENAREIIKTQLEKGSDAVPWKNVPKFSELVLKERIKDFKKAKATIFFDRGIPDIIAYLWVDNFDVSSKLNKSAKKYKYNKKVFVTQPWRKIYKKDSERKESFEKSIKIFNKIKECYSYYDYEIILLPRDKQEKVVKFILENID